MADAVRILAFSGSLRAESFNAKLVRIAADAAGRAGAAVDLIRLRDYPLPVYDGDFEQANGLPDEAKALKSKFKQSDGLLIAAPEYNSSISAALKNVIDWASRPEPDEPPLVCFRGKVAAIMSASPGGLGGLRGLVHVRSILSNIHTLVLTDQKAIGAAHDAFDDNGNLTNERDQQAIEALGTTLVETIAKLKA